MGIVSEFQRLEDARLLNVYLTAIAGYMVKVEEYMALIKALENKYPADATEVTTLIAEKKLAIQKVIDKY
jgi:hypothetical protein